jgi:cephalosporin hydroxylase
LITHTASNHAYEELYVYEPFVSKGSYCVVFDTIVEDLAKKNVRRLSMGTHNNSKTVVWEFLKTNPEFEVEKSIDKVNYINL